MLYKVMACIKRKASIKANSKNKKEAFKNN